MKGLKKIAIEASNLIDAQPTGIPKYTFNIINGLLSNNGFCSQNDLSLLLSVSRWKKRKLCPEFNHIKKHWYVKNFLLNDVNLIHYTSTFHNHHKKIPKVATVHDLAVLKQENSMPFYTSQETIERTRQNMQAIAKNAHAIIFVSETTRQDFLNLYAYPEKQTYVVYLGSSFAAYEFPVAEASILKKYNIRQKKYYLYTGGVSIRKNVLNLVKAFIRNMEKTDFDMVLAGTNGFGSDLIYSEIQKYDLTGRIKCPGFVADTDLIELYQNAAAFVFPTFYEGFGIPIIDAMKFNLPVLIGNRGSASEIANGFATIVDPFNVGSIAEGLGNLVNVKGEQLTKAKEYAKGLTWQVNAQKTWDVYKTLVQ